MSESKLNNLIEKLQKYLEVESLMGKERIECSKSIFEDINESQKFILKGRKKSADIMFIREISQSDIDDSIEKNNLKLLKKIIEALKYSEEQVLVMILEKYSHASIDEYKININNEILEAQPKSIIFMGDNFKPIIDNNENKQITLNSISKYLNIPALLICDLNFMIKNPECKKLVWKCMLELQKKLTQGE